MNTHSESQVADVDVLVVGAGVAGIYATYSVVQAGLSVRVMDQAGGPGGTWYWNRYPGARFDSESYSYGYTFSEELFREWRWSEHFAGQPEIERYLTHVVDRFDLRRYMQFDTEVVAADWDDVTHTWTVRTAAGERVRCRYLIATTGRLSVPYFPAIPGRESFRGLSLHTGRWPAEPVDFSGKRVAVIGTASSGSQLIQEIVGDVESLTVYQRTANWVTPLNNGPITKEEYAELDAGFADLKEFLGTADTGFLHTPRQRKAFEDNKDERWAFYEKLWNTRGFAKQYGNYEDLMTDPLVNADFCEFLSEKVREIVTDPVLAEKLIPTDHGFGHRRPTFARGFLQAFNDPAVTLVDIKNDPIERVTETGIRTGETELDFDIIVWATGFDFGSGALMNMGVRGRDGERLKDHWSEGPDDYLGLQSVGFPNLFFPGGPHGSPGTLSVAVVDMVNFVVGALEYMSRNGYTSIEPTLEAEQGWVRYIDEAAERLPYAVGGYFFGANIPGKPRRFLMNPNPRSEYQQILRDLVENGYRPGFVLSALDPQDEAARDEDDSSRESALVNACE